MIQYYDVILSPVVTEKSMKQTNEGKYVFLVNPIVNKIDIKNAIMKMFEGVKVKSVNIVNNIGKKRRRGFIVGRTNKYKKAIVTLEKGSKNIELFSNLTDL